MRIRFRQAALVAVLTGAILCIVLLGKVFPARIPIVVNTWAFTDATTKAWDVLRSGGSALDAVEQGCSVCERLQCDLTVGYGGSPDEEGQTTLDALIFDGTAMDMGAVTDLRYVKRAISTARMVMAHSLHSSLGGLQATSFAVEMGAKLSNLSTPTSSDMYYAWKANNCQPNFRKDVTPDPTRSCGPYKPKKAGEGTPAQPAPSAAAAQGPAPGTAGGPDPPELAGPGAPAGSDSQRRVSRRSHDTISMLAVDAGGNVAAGSSTNGAAHKIPGRTSDAAVAGAGVYADSKIGGCGSTGDGDVHLRFLPCYQAVENMRQGMRPRAAAEDAVRRILQHYPDYVGALVTVNARGEHAGAAHGWRFEYAVRNAQLGKVTVFPVDPLSGVNPGVGSALLLRLRAALTGGRA